MNKTLDKIGKVTNIILILVYAFLMFFGFLAGFMAGEAIGDIPEPSLMQKVFIVYIPSILGLLGPVVIIVSMLLSARFRNTGKSVGSFIIQFLPLVYYALFMIFISFI